MKSFNLKSKILLISIAGLLIALYTNAQQYGWDWANSSGGVSGDMGNSLATDTNGNVYIAGEFSDTAFFSTDTLIAAGGVGSTNAFIAKYDSLGNVQWANQVSGSSSASAICTDYLGNVLITGRFSGTANFGITSLTSQGNIDVFVVKYNSLGNEIWAIRDGYMDYDNPYDICVDTSGNIYITGEFIYQTRFGSKHLFAVGGLYDRDIFIVKYDNSGTVKWAVRDGSSNNDKGNGIAVDVKGNVYITGLYYDVFNGKTIYLSKYDNTGNVDWSKWINGSSYNEGMGVYVDDVFDVYVTGKFGSTTNFGSTSLTSSGGADIFIAKYDSSGIEQWAKKGGGTWSDIGNGVYVDSSAVYITGQFAGTGHFDGISITSTASSGIINGFITKYNKSGNVQWAKPLNGTSYLSGEDLNISKNQDIYITGWYSDTSFFGSTVLLSAGHNDIFLSKLSLCKLSVSIGNDTSVCGNVTLDAGSGYSNYNWNSGSSNTQTINIHSSGTYYVDVTSSDGCVASDTINIIVNTLPVVNLGNDTTICVNDSIIFDAGAGFTNYAWSNGTASQTINVNSTNDYYVTVTDSNSCSTTDSVSLTVNSKYFILDSVSICNDYSILLEGSYQTISGTYYDTLATVNGCDSVIETTLTVNPTYYFNDPTVEICTGDSVLIYGTYRNTSGTYYDSLITVAGCDSVHSTAITVYPTYSITDPGFAICSGDSALLYGTYQTATGTYYDSLTTANGCDSIMATALTVNPTYTVNHTAEICQGDSILLGGLYQTTAGTYYDTYQTADNCDGTIATDLTVHPLPSKPIITQSGDSLISTVATSYQWYYNDTLIIEATNQFYEPTKSGLYTVQITDVNECSIMADPYDFTLTAISELDKFNELSVFPNPSSGIFTIKLKSQKTEKVTIQIYNTLGQLIFTDQSESVTGNYENRIDLNNYPVGVYKLQVEIEQGTFTKKIIIR